MIYEPVNRGFPKFQKHFVGPYVVAANPIANGVTYILRSLDNGNIVHEHRNHLKICNVTFSKHQAVDVYLDQFAELPEQHAQNMQVVDAASSVNPRAALPVADIPAVGPLVPSADLTKPAIQERADRPPVAERLRYKIKPHDRLVDRYTPALANKSKKIITALDVNTKHLIFFLISALLEFNLNRIYRSNLYSHSIFSVIGFLLF